LYHDKAIGCYNACADVAVVSTSRSVSSGSGGRKRWMDPGCVLGGFRVPVQGPVRGERLMHATEFTNVLSRYIVN
jgi:hypothetical protein